MLNVTTYGAVAGGNPVDNRAAFQAWADALGTNGGVGYVPSAAASEYGISSQITFNLTKPTRIIGDGPGLSTIRLTGTGDLWAIVKSDHSYLEVAGLTFKNSMASNGLGLNIIYPFIPSGTQVAPKLCSLSFSGLDVAQHGWLQALRVENAWNMEFDTIHVKGKDGILSPYGGNGILLHQCMAPRLEGLRIYHVDDAIASSGTGWSEGWNICDFELVGVKNGIWLPAASTIAAGTSFYDGHINADNRCIYMANRRYTQLHDLLLMKIPQANGRYWRGIDLVSCSDYGIEGVGFFGNPQAGGGNDCLVGLNCNRVLADGLMGGDFASVGSICIIQGSTSNWQMGRRSLGPNCSGPVNMASGSGNIGF